MAEDAAALKSLGNEKWKVGEFAAAIEAYTRSLELDPTQHLCYSNRSAAYLKLGGSAEDALRDAEKCIELKPDWPKGYSRQAAALQELKRWEEAVAICEKGLAITGDGALQNMLSEVRTRQFSERIRGTWHGRVSDELGGYDQEMEFVDASNVRVEVLGRSIVGQYYLDCKPEPHHLNIQVPMHEAPPGMPPPPPVPYIAKIEQDCLHLCCPFMKMDRPTEFAGPGYCCMSYGPMAQGQEADVAAKLSKDERLLLCTKELIKALPSSKLEEPQQTDSEDVAREKLMSQVRFEASMFQVQKRFSEEIMKEVLNATRADPPASLAAAPEFQTLKDKLRTCGILEEDTSSVAASAGSAGPEKIEPAAKPSSAKAAEGTGGPAAEDGASAGGFSSGVVLALSLGAVAAVAAVAFLSSRRQRR
mmetsp:Transcript_90837/g.256573  ORF Transcript_90837/g.256573 Transcript_90837/m.256573 type:complete len:418 (+) Transcript_90837:84-1337(+)